MANNQQHPNYPPQQPYSHGNQQSYPGGTQAYPNAGRYPNNTYSNGAGQAQSGAYRPASYTAGRNMGAHGNPGGPQGQPPRKKKGRGWRIVFWVALVVLILALIALGAILYSYWQGQHKYDELSDEYFEAPNDIDAANLDDLTVDGDALLAINPDTVGWIYIPDTMVNYPIVHTTDNEYYLTHDFEGSEGLLAHHGAIFLSAENKPDFSDANCVLFGHNMRDGSMFATINGFQEESEFDAHRTIYILTPNGNYRLKSFSLLHCDADEEILRISFSSDESQTDYVQDKIDRSIHEVNDIPEASDITKTFTFSTCDSITTEGRYILFAYVLETTVPDETAVDEIGGTTTDEDVAAVDDAAKEITS